MIPQRNHSQIKRLIKKWFDFYDLPIPHIVYKKSMRHAAYIDFSPLTFVYEEDLLYEPHYKLTLIILHEIGHYKYRFEETDSIAIAIISEFFAFRFSFRELFKFNPVECKSLYDDFLEELKDKEFKEKFPIHALAGRITYGWFNKYPDEVGLKSRRKKAR